MANKIEFKVLADIQNFEKGLKQVHDVSKKIATEAGKAFLAFGAALAFTIKEAKEAEQVFNRTQAVIKSTGGVAGVTAKQAADLAKELQNISTFGDEAILSAENLLLTFKEVGRETFPRATKAILDTSIAMNQGLKETVIQVGKALNEPIEGLAALRRVGIQFTDAQENQIKVLAKTNQVAKAQGLILEELESQFGGSAEAARQGLGAFDALSNSFKDLGEAVGKVLAPALIKLANILISLVNFIESNKTIVTLIAVFIGLGAAISGVTFLVAGFVAAITTIGGAAATAIALLTTALGVGGFAFFRFNEEINKTKTALIGDDGLFKKASKQVQEFSGFVATAKEKLAELKDESMLLGTAIQAGLSGLLGTDLGTITVSAPGQKGTQTPAFIQGFKDGLSEIEAKVTDIKLAGKDMALTLHSAFSTALSGMILGVTTAKEAFKAFGQTMLQAIVKFVTEWLAFQILSKAQAVVAQAFAIGLAASLASAWAPAAALASLASFGGNAAPAATALISTVALSQFLAIPKFAEGSGGVKDDTLGLFNKKEMVIPASFADAIRSGELVLSGEGGQQGVYIDLKGATFNGITQEFVEDIFKKAGEGIANRTLVFSV